jgi:hypothetical protein
LFSQTASNQSSVLDAGARFPGLIGMTEGPGGNGYPGFDDWRVELVRRSVRADRIVPVPNGSVPGSGSVTPRHTTLTEAYGLVTFSRERRMTGVVIVAPPWHLLRCFMACVGALLRDYPDLELFPAFGTSLPWQEEAVHSQGSLKGSRADFVFHETTRIFRYHAQGDLPDPERVLAYVESVFI